MTDPNPLAGEPGYLTWLAVGRSHHKCHRALNARLASLDLSLAQHEVLVGIAQRPGATQNQISRRLFVVKSNVSALIAKLEARGLVRREASAEDSRVKRLFLTEAGDALVRESFRLQTEVVNAMMAPLTPEEIEATRDVMERVGRALDALDGD